jgi:hypothetical protein
MTVTLVDSMGLTDGDGAATPMPLSAGKSMLYLQDRHLHQQGLLSQVAGNVWVAK